MNNKTKKIVLNGLMIALVCISTMAIQIPVPGTHGYVNIGDSIIFVTSILFGPISGFLAGGMGSAFADILSGYTHWALFTFIIKGLEGYIVGMLAKKGDTIFKNVSSTIIGAIIMVLGYFIAGAFLEGSFAVSSTSIPSNSIQGIVSIIVSLPIYQSLSNINYIKSLKKHSQI
ncbi:MULTISPECIES: ECF transporter S component [unclassified Romboutsia]|uniref:ECF transporter S component n=1 Tax=unclassified Romboutsia TaxID=2626894 RepID=UPI000822E2DE|nr:MULTISPECIES: ECF transporter S component [unclassified Romboutsia]SCI15627.1 Thiamine precursor ECF transporter S component HmpT [uncultured Clostridium sp.]